MDEDELKYLNDLDEKKCPLCGSYKLLFFVNNPGEWICKECGYKFNTTNEKEK